MGGKGVSECKEILNHGRSGKEGSEGVHRATTCNAASPSADLVRGFDAVARTRTRRVALAVWVDRLKGAPTYSSA